MLKGFWRVATRTNALRQSDYLFILFYRDPVATRTNALRQRKRELYVNALGSVATRTNALRQSANMIGGTF